MTCVFQKAAVEMYQAFYVSVDLAGIVTNVVLVTCMLRVETGRLLKNPCCCSTGWLGLVCR